MMQVKQFWQTYRHWLLNLLREVTEKPTHAIPANTKRIASLMLKGIEQNGYCSNREMEIIIQSNYSNIKNIIEQGCENSIELLKELDQAYKGAKAAKAFNKPATEAERLQILQGEYDDHSDEIFG